MSCKHHSGIQILATLKRSAVLRAIPAGTRPKRKGFLATPLCCRLAGEARPSSSLSSLLMVMTSTTACKDGAQPSVYIYIYYKIVEALLCNRSLAVTYTTKDNIDQVSSIKWN